jgi:monoamine oxidase
VGVAALFDESDTAPEPGLLPSDDRFVIGGMDRLPALLALDLDIRLGQVVKRVEWREGAVKVSTGDAVWEADAVVITLPVGVLAAGTVTFAPGLPAAFTQSLGRLRMGLLNKVYMRFPQVFWDPEADFLTFYSDPPPICYAWLNLHRYTGEPALLGFTSGAMAHKVEGMSDEQIGRALARRLRNGRGGAAPEAEVVRASHWASDPFARGSYSYPGIGGSGRDRQRMAVPVARTLFFAGEATHRDDPASVHGAWWSGLRAAQQILGQA